MNIEVYSDGSATTIDKPGGWAWVMVIDGVKHSEGSGYSPSATNNDMELEAAIQGLTATLKCVKEISTHSSPEFHEVTLCSDSQIVLNWATGQFRFKQESKIDKYNQLQFLVKRMGVKTRWIKGHSGDEHNTRCDKLANMARKGVQEVLDKSSQVVDTKIGKKKNGTASLWFSGKLMVLDFEQGIIEPYNREAHGKRGSLVEIREGKDR